MVTQYLLQIVQMSSKGRTDERRHRSVLTPDPLTLASIYYSSTITWSSPLSSPLRHPPTSPSPHHLLSVCDRPFSLDHCLHRHRPYLHTLCQNPPGTRYFACCKWAYCLTHFCCCCADREQHRTFDFDVDSVTSY